MIIDYITYIYIRLVSVIVILVRKIGSFATLFVVLWHNSHRRCDYGASTLASGCSWNRMGISWVYNHIYPLVNIQKAMENGHL